MQQLRQAISIAQQGDDDHALALTNALLARHPEFVPALKLQGTLLEDMGHQSDAALSYEKALTLAPNDPELLLKVGVFQLIADHDDEAISLLRHRLRLVPHDRDALYYLAQAFHLSGQNELALKVIKECVEVDPTNPSVWQKYGELLGGAGDNEGALRWLLKAQHSDPTLERIDFDLGVVSYNDMDFPAALKYAINAAELQPGDPEVFKLLAAAQIKLSQWQNAKDTFARILAIRKDDLPSLLGLGQCEVELKQYQAAIDTLEHLEQVDPTQILAHFYLSRAFAGLGEASEAQQEADLHNSMMQQLPAGQLDEDAEHEKAIWSQGRQLLIQKRETEAHDLFQWSYKGAAATPGGSYVFVGALYLSLGNPQDALRNLNHALEVEPNVRGAHTYIGVLALQRGDLSKAEDEFETELAHHPNYRTAIAEMGELRYLQGRWSDAADELTKSRTMNPSLLYLLCDSYFRLGKTKDARLTAEILAAYGRNDPQVMRALIDMVGRNGDSELAQRLSSNLKR
jgi:tetratricopeptide (TPR) repeat protein